MGYGKKCKDCGAPISFVQTGAGKWLVIDPGECYVLPEPGSRRLYSDVFGKIFGAVEVGESTPGRIYAHIPHWTTCAAAAKKKYAQRMQRMEKHRQEKEAAEKAARAEAEEKRAAEEAKARQAQALEKEQRKWKKAQCGLWGNHDYD